MKKLFSRISILVTGLALSLGMGIAAMHGISERAFRARAADSTTTMTWGTVGTSNTFTFSDSGDTYLEFSFGGADNMAGNATDLRMFAGAWLTINAKAEYSTTTKIKNLVITAKNSHSTNTNYLYYNATTGEKVNSAGTGVTTITFSGGTTEVTKTASFGDGLNSVTIARATNGNNIRISSILVTYEYTPATSPDFYIVFTAHRRGP